MNKKTPYWLDYLRHPRHLMALGVGCTAALLASLPWGGDGFGLGLLAIAAIETVAIAVVPNLPPFREWADRRERERTLAQTYARLQAEIESHGGSDHLHSFWQMIGRVASLYRMAEDADSTLTRADVQRLEDTTVDYLRLCLSDAAMRESRRSSSSGEQPLQNRLREVRQALERPGLSPHETAQLRRAEADFAEALSRLGRMASRRAMLDAALLSMPARMDEVYEMVMTAPRAGNMGSLLEESLAKLRISEEVAMDLDQELGFGGAAPYAAVPHVASPPAPPVAVRKSAAAAQGRR